MVEAGGDLDLTQKPIGPEHRRQLGPQHLDRHLALVFQIVREIDRRHAAASELSLDGVAAGEGGVEALAEVPQRGGRGAQERGTGWSLSTGSAQGPTSVRYCLAITRAV